MLMNVTATSGLVACKPSSARLPKSADGVAGGRGHKKNLNLKSDSSFPKRDIAAMNANSTIGQIAKQAGTSRYRAEQALRHRKHEKEHRLLYYLNCSMHRIESN
jgi:hypothetical protein